MWNLAAPPGFQGLREDLSLDVYYRHLPHWRQNGAMYFVTFRLGDSLPQVKLRELAAWRSNWERSHPLPRSNAAYQQFSEEMIRRVEKWLDQGMGSCLLRNAANATMVAETLRHFDDERYQLASYVLMPNHIHVLVRPLRVSQYTLEDILQSWKQFSAKRINRSMNKTGPVWQEENFDRIVRDEEHLYRCIQYIGTNAAKAGLTLDDCPRWIRPEWEALGWKFVDE